MEKANPDIQLISNIVVKNNEGQILFVKYDPDDERWWLPGDDLVPYQHPDERAAEILNGLPGLKWSGLKMVFIESFRGRRGWHVMFNYSVKGEGDPMGDTPSKWFPADNLPQTMHGKWEVGVVKQILVQHSNHVPDRNLGWLESHPKCITDSSYEPGSIPA